MFRRLKYKTVTRRDCIGSSLSFCTSSISSCTCTPCQSTEDLHLPEILAKTVIKRNVDKLGLLADRIERLNSSLGLVLAEAPARIASQQDLDHPLADISYEVGLDVQSQYLEALEELVLA